MNRIALALAALLASTSLPAGAALAGADVARAELKEARAALRDDEKDLKELEKIVDRWESRRAAGKVDKLGPVDEDLQEWLREEASEQRSDLAEFAAEHDVDTTPPHPQEDLRELREDRTAADRRYARLEDELDRLREVRRALADMQPRFDRGRASPEDLREKSELLAELVELTGRDVRRAERAVARAEKALDAAR